MGRGFLIHPYNYGCVQTTSSGGRAMMGRQVGGSQTVLGPAVRGTTSQPLVRDRRRDLTLRRQTTLPTLIVATLRAPSAAKVTFTLSFLPFIPLSIFSLDLVAFRIFALPAYHWNL